MQVGDVDANNFQNRQLRVLVPFETFRLRITFSENGIKNFDVFTRTFEQLHLRHNCSGLMMHRGLSMLRQIESITPKIPDLISRRCTMQKLLRDT